jgi:hypothetical protein
VRAGGWSHNSFEEKKVFAAAFLFWNDRTRRGGKEKISDAEEEQKCVIFNIDFLVSQLL